MQSKMLQHFNFIFLFRVAFEAQDGKEVPQNLKELALRYLRENHPEELTSSSESASNNSSCSCFIVSYLCHKLISHYFNTYHFHVSNLQEQRSLVQRKCKKWLSIICQHQTCHLLHFVTWSATIFYPITLTLSNTWVRDIFFSISTYEVIISLTISKLLYNFLNILQRQQQTCMDFMESKATLMNLIMGIQIEACMVPAESIPEYLQEN